MAGEVRDGAKPRGNYERFRPQPRSHGGWHRSRTNLLLVLVSVVAGVLLLTNLLGGSGDAKSAAVDVTPADGALVLGSTVERPAADATAKEAVAFWREHMVAQPDDLAAATQLAISLNEVARLDGDPSAAEEATAILTPVLDAEPDARIARRAQALAILGAHDFAGAAGRANSFLSTDPADAEGLAIAVDASIGLGELDDAGDYLARLTDVANDARTSARAALLAWMVADPDSAISSAERAVAEADAEGQRPDEIAWFENELGRYHRLSGDHTAALSAYERAIDMDPDSAPALYGAARSTAALGDLTAAADLAERAAGTQPNAEYLGFLGDLHQMNGDADAVEPTYQTAELALALVSPEGETAAGYRRMEARFHADRMRNTEVAVSSARDDLDERSDFYAYDTLAWALLADGKATEALKVLDSYSGPVPIDAVLSYHRGRVELDAGQTEAGQASVREALSTDPAFDPIHAQQAAFIEFANETAGS